MSERGVRIALTVGDPGGVGPEIVGSLLARGRLVGADAYILGAYAALERWLPARECGRRRPVPLAEAPRLKPPDSFPVFIDTGEEAAYRVGIRTAEGGRASGRAIEAAASLAKRGLVDGIVTGPISKEALALAGYAKCSHTELLADLFGAPACEMMMVAGALRIVILTRDIPLRNVPGAVTAPRIESGVRTTDGALRELFGVERPRIAVAALNPHAGDGGVLGTEERVTIAPAVASLRAGGLRVDGPFPADTLFYKWEEKGYDAFVALYHDQGMIPFKAGGFDQGVNMTIGLPVVRTSVCHGTAFDIAGTGTAETGSFESAFELAVACCRTRLARRPARGRE